MSIIFSYYDNISLKYKTKTLKYENLCLKYENFNTHNMLIINDLDKSSILSYLGNNV